MLQKRKIEAPRVSDEHQDGDTVFNEVFQMEYADKKAKFEWNALIYAQFGVLILAILLNFIFQKYMAAILIVSIIAFIFLYYANTKKRVALLKSGRVKKIRLKNDQRQIKGYMSIKPANALDIMKEDCVIIEVSVKDYYDEMHVKNAISIPLEEFDEKIEKMSLKKDTTILLYARGTERSKEAAQTLIDKGFSDVYEFGSIMDWPYDVVLNGEE